MLTKFPALGMGRTEMAKKLTLISLQKFCEFSNGISAWIVLKHSLYYLVSIPNGTFKVWDTNFPKNCIICRGDALGTGQAKS
jgi:hypothetical protein